MDSRYAPWLFAMGVSPFGNPRIEAYLQLPVAYRSLSRPSSAPDAKAFTLCSYSLELSKNDLDDLFCCSLELLEFHKQITFSGSILRKKVFLLAALNLPPFGEIVFTLILERPILIKKFVLSNLFVSTLQYALFGFQ